MKIGFLATDPAVVPVLEAVRSLPDMDLVGGWTTLEWDPPLSPLLSWERLLTETRLDALIVAGTDEGLLQAARQFVGIGVPLLVVTDSQQGPNSIFRYLPIWQESPERVSPLFVSGVSAVACRLAQLARSRSAGGIWKVEFERTLHRSPGTGISPEEIDRWFFQDLDWMESDFGPHRNVTHLTSGFGTQGPLESEITLIGPVSAGVAAPEVRWRLKGDANHSGWSLILHGIEGSVAANCRNDVIQFQTDPSAGPELVSPSSTAGSAVVQDLRRQLLAFQEACESRRPGRSWEEVIRLGEMGAAARRSLLRRRTVEVQHEQVSERTQFKSQMATIGCGVLLWVMFGGMAMLLISAGIDPRDREVRLAETSGFVVAIADFEPDSDQLTGQGQNRLDVIQSQWSSTSPVVLVEALAQEETLNRQRLSRVVTLLSEAGIRDAAQRVSSRRLQGTWYSWIILAGWGVVLLPVFAVLGLQLLILAARESADSEQRSNLG